MFEKELQQLGLSEKEAKVYLASLELGPNSVLAISKKTDLKRSTTDYTIKELIKKGLMNSFEKGKKTYFTVESPERLISLITVRKRKVLTVEEDLKQLLPELNKIFELTGEKPRVRFFEGKEGIQVIQKEVLKWKFNSAEEFYPLDEVYKIFPPHPNDHREKFKKKLKRNRIQERVIYTSKKGKILPEKEGLAEYRFIPTNKFLFSSEIAIYGNKIVIIAYKGKLIGIIIESEEIANSLKAIFNLAWEAAKKY